MKALLAIPILLILALGLSLQEVEADLVPEQAYLLEGSGFAVTEDVIKNSQIDFLIDLDRQIGSTTKLVVEDGFVTLGEMEFNVADITGSVLRDGHFIRLTGTADDSLGNEVSLSAFGRLIEDSQEGSVYSFTGRLSEGIFTNKIILTTKISQITTDLPTITAPGEPAPTLEEQIEEKEILVRISPAASEQGFDLTYVEAYAAQAAATSEQGDDPTRARYLYPNRLTITPGTTLTFQNDDDVSHTIVSAKRDTNARGIGHDFRMHIDGRVNSGEIPPGESRSVIIYDKGFIFLMDPDYAWVRMDVVSFPEVSQTQIIKSSTERRQKGN